MALIFLPVILNLPIHDPIPPVDGETVTQPVSFITEEEKLVVLRMLQDKKLTIEEADKLLDALEYSAQE